MIVIEMIIQALDSKPGSFNHTCISFHLQNYIFFMGDELSYGLNTLGRYASGNV